jgi:hypothetical protein
MRVRITHCRRGEVDGVDLSSFEVGSTYDVSPSLATYLIMTGTADPIVDEAKTDKKVSSSQLPVQSSVVSSKSG